MASRARPPAGPLPFGQRPLRQGTAAIARSALRRRAVIPPYKYTVDDAVLDVFAATTKRHREKLLRIFGQLADDPFLPGDTLQRDYVGRPLQVRRFGEWTVTYWPEHLSKEVHIVAIEYLRM